MFKRKSGKSFRVFFVLVIFVIGIAIALTFLTRENKSVSEKESASVRTPSSTATSTPPPTPSPLTQELEPKIEADLSPLQGDWSCYVKDLSTGETITYNDHKGPSASLIKLFTAGCYEQELSDGTIQATDASEQNEAMMISYSDNDAWVALETEIGQGSYSNGHQLVQQFARSHGFASTGRLVDENDNPDPEGGMNWTSVSDVGNCLDQIYNGTYVSKEASEKILNLMKQQVHVNKIPAGLPEGTICANKTGELDLTQNDAAIVYGPKKNYILVVMSDGMEDGDEAVQHIVDLSSEVYQFMEK